VPKDVHPLSNSDVNPFPYKFVVITFASVLAILLVIGLSWYFIGGNTRKAENTLSRDFRNTTTTARNKSSQETIITIIPTQTPTPTLIPTPTVAPINASWKRFTSTKYGYTFQYPETYTAGVTNQTDPKILEFIVINPASASSAAVMNITLSYSTRTYAEALALNSTAAESITVAGVPGSRKVVRNSQNQVSVHVIFPDDNRSVTFVAKDNYKDVLTQILSTFKFVN
jgi:hypothetical protein